ncbi:dihydrofolate reductase [Leucobacter sp. Psy1]|uniref:dihydrofolate reductase n=1 Tax=Leucobacter sp. Psy1 TaxID=2875729 RepID=UPI001CD7D1F4|nr:dihydrofolate reductase [Leucobacter sp. Psy1]UBH05568.1 dihydrofolate reductase [Leucobacter sp. Psy1]
MTTKDELRDDLQPRIGEGVGMIWAEGRDGAIGRGGQMPWHLPEDLAHFKEQTWGAPVVMGRRTWESLPERFRPLPGRENVVVTRNERYVASGAVVVPSIEAALERTSGVVQREYAEHLENLAAAEGAACQSPGSWPEIGVWIMGGGELYRAAMPAATDLVVTRIDVAVPNADTHAPRIDAEWQLVRSEGPHRSRTGLDYRFEWYRRHDGGLGE